MLAGCGLASVLAACSRDAAPPASLHVTLFALQGEREVLLNEALDFHFDQDLDPASVTPASVRVVGPDGEPAEGQLQVYGSRLSFLPDLPLAPNLQDGGFRPGTAYRVLLLGFPVPDGLRALDGRPLAGSREFGFETVAAPDGPDGRGGRTFEDTNVQLTRTLRLLTDTLGVLDSIELEVTEAVDPSSLTSEDFELRGQGGRERIPLRVQLRSNRPERAVIALTPVAAPGGPVRRLSPGTYHLWSDPTRTSLCDLGGNPVVSPWILPVDIRVEGAQTAGGESDRQRAWWVSGTSSRGASSHVLEDFVNSNMRSPVAVAGADGTASWDEAGVVTVRLPAAAGSGRAGRVELTASEARADVEATRISVPAGLRAELSSAGLVVLRAQGSIVIDGDLVRRRGQPAMPPPPMDFGRGSPYDTRPQRGDRPLSEWVAEARAADPPWTVLIAGGDLIVRGSIDVDTPLVLVSGGWIRVSGAVRAEEVFVQGDGGRGAQFDPVPKRAPLALDPPLDNPLVEPQSWAVQSQPWRPPEGAAAWLPARVEGHAGGGSYTVRFLGERDTEDGELETQGPVDDPSELVDCTAIRFLIELTMEVGGPWFPPLVDSIELAWIPQAAKPEDR